ncbi:TPA: hypothetical protein ACX7ZB_005599, partial [Escherichia coli]
MTGRSKPQVVGGHIPIAGIVLAARPVINQEDWTQKNRMSVGRGNRYLLRCFEHHEAEYIPVNAALSNDLFFKDLTRSLFGNFDLTILKYPVACGAFLPSD